MRHRDGHVGRSAARQVDGLVEQLQRAVGGHDRRDQDDRLEQRNGDLEELLHLVGAVDAGRLVDRILDALHGGEVEAHVVARPAPDQAEDDDHLGVERIVQPVDRLGNHAHLHQQRVDHAVIGEQRAEDHGVGDQAGRTGQEDAGAEQAAELEVPVVEQRGEDDGQHQHDRHLDDQVGEGVLDGLDEHLVLEHVGVIAVERIGILQRRRQAALEGGQERLKHRPEAEQDDQQRGGQQEGPAGRALLALHTPEALLSRRRGRVGHREVHLSLLALLIRRTAAPGSRSGSILTGNLEIRSPWRSSRCPRRSAARRRDRRR